MIVALFIVCASGGIVAAGMAAFFYGRMREADNSARRLERLRRSIVDQRYA